MKLSSPCKFHPGDLVRVTRVPEVSEVHIDPAAEWWGQIKVWVDNQTILEVQESELWEFDPTDLWWVLIVGEMFCVPEMIAELVFSI